MQQEWREARPPGLRTLMEEATQTKDVQVVYTATEWLNATVTEGVEHIELRNHVDLTTVDVEDVTSGRSESSQDFMQGIIPRSLKSVRVWCCPCLRLCPAFITNVVITDAETVKFHVSYSGNEKGIVDGL